MIESQILMTRTTLFSFTALTATLSLATPIWAQTSSQNLDSITDEIIVTGSPFNRSVDEAITGVSVLSGDELADRLAGTIGETLKSEPGVSSTFFGAGASRPILRGQGGDRVRVLTNGIGSIDASSASPDHAVAAEPAQAERIEVLRGASLLRYGSSGAGGVVNVIDGRIPDTLPEDGTDGAIRFGVSSVDEGREIAASVNQAFGNLVLHLDGTFKETEDYDIPGFAESQAFRDAEEAEHEEEHEDEDHDEDEHHDEEEHEEAFGTLENSATETKSITGGLSYVGDNGFFGVSIHRFESDYGVPGGHEHGEVDDHEDEDHEDEDHEDEDHDEHDHEAEEGDVTIGLKQTRIDVNGRANVDGFFEAVQVFGGYADYEHTEFEGPGVIGTVFANEGFELRGEVIQREQNGWRGAYGVQMRQREFSAVGEEAFVAPTKTKQYGFYSFQEKQIGDLHLEGAVRYERTDQIVTESGAGVRFNAFSASAGGDLHLTDALRFGGTVFRTERAPTTEELFSNGPHLATSQFELGDDSLGLETATGVEAAIRHREAGHFVTLNLFYTDYDDYVFEQATGLEEDGLDVFQFTAEDAKFHGFELQGGLDVAQFGAFDIKADSLVEYVRAKTDSGNLPRIPPLSILTGVEAESDRLSLRAELDYSAEQNKVSVNEIPTEDYALTNFFVTWKPDLGEQPIRVSIALLNAFDVEARQHTSFLKDLVPLQGRNIRFSVGTRF
ncbi:iron complex outermembrane receptor protein [Litorimonas taeanensis]|uniref:Iron complex outermembrane receptor protein n=2 Tax=Litorimonas taeanensis TaxID=568099 RepID=A0A420WER4_9PROT|nr:iron complex outermembrane receptor protein [Litorimonas taeanensis]